MSRAAAGGPAPAGGILLYDGSCGFCTWAARAATLLASRPRPVPYQNAGLWRLGLTQRKAERSVYWVVGRQKFSGPEAIAALLRRSHWPLRTVAAVLEAPHLRPAVHRAYRWVSAHRHDFPGGRAALRVPPARRP